MANLLEGLNPAQMAAVTQYQNPSLIIAGAGSGKTRVLTARIAYMLQQGVAPHSILALTFTNKAASQMKERLGEMIDPQLLRSITMGTFHSIFSRIIRENAEALGYPTSYTIYQPSDAKSLIKTILKEMNLSDDKYKPNSILSRISFAKNSLITPAAYIANDSFATEDRERKIPEFANIYATYCTRCKASGALDFDDLLLQTNILFRDFPEVLRRYQERFQYILVDEYQDTNYAQYIIIRRLSQLHGRVCVVGDDAQSIYSFRGAKIENILNFRKHFPTAETFKLEQNYRSTQTIVDAANSLIAHNHSKLDKRCFSAGERGEKIRIMKAVTDRDEAHQVVMSITNRRKEESTPWSEFAVLYRTNSQSQAIEQALRQSGIPYQIHRGNSFYEHKEIKDLMAYIRIIINPRDDEAFKRIINYPARGIGEVTLTKISDLSQSQGRSMWDVINEMVDQPPADAQQRTIIRKVKEFVELIRSLSQERVQMGLYDFGLQVATRSGILPMYRMQSDTEAKSAVDNIEELLNTMQLFNEQIEAQMRSGEREEEDTATIEEWLQSVLLLTDQDTDEEQNERVTLMTVHSSKGLEYGYIYIVGVEHNLFPSQRAVESGEVEEERRLFYVAITRAKMAATISYCDMRFKWGTMDFSRPSSFLCDIDPKYLDMDEDVELRRYETSRRPNSTNDSKYSTPSASPQRTTTATGSMQGRSKAEATAILRKQFDYRHQQQKQQPAQQIVPNNASLRSVGRRASEPQSGESQSSRTQSGGTTYNIGDRVLHERFGKGRIVAIEPWNNSNLLKIDFESVGTKSVVEKMAPIKRL